MAPNARVLPPLPPQTHTHIVFQDNIYMNAVDTGWINDENPLPHAARIATEHNFQTPIDEVRLTEEFLCL